MEVDFGAARDSTGNSFTITATNNTASGLLHFEQWPYVQVLEGCCPPSLTVGAMTAELVRGTTITSSVFRLSPGGDDRHNYAMHLVTNDPQQPDTVVNVRLNRME